MCLMDFPSESELLLVVLIYRYEGGKAFARSLVAYQVLGDVLICSKNKTTSGFIGITI